MLIKKRTPWDVVPGGVSRSSHQTKEVGVRRPSRPLESYFSIKQKLVQGELDTFINGQPQA